MRKLRAILPVILSIGMIVSLVGCGNTAQTTTGGNTQSSNAPKAATKDDALAFYKGKTVNLVVPYSTGGGYDQYARLVAPYLQKYIPGITVVVRNTPGAGGLTGTNEVFLAKPDGLTIGILNGVGVVTNQAVGQEGVKFDLNKFSWIGRFNNEPEVVIVDASKPYKTIDDVKKAGPVKFAINGVGSSQYVGLVVTKQILLPQMDIISGYNTSAEGDVAMLRGEVLGTNGSVSSKESLIVEQKKATPILLYGTEKNPNYPNVPLAIDITTGAQKELATNFTNLLNLGRLLAAPPEVPQERIDLLREAFQKALSDPELLDKAKKSKLDIQYLSGPDSAKLVKDSLQMPADLKDLMKKALSGK